MVRHVVFALLVALGVSRSGSASARGALARAPAPAVVSAAVADKRVQRMALPLSFDRLSNADGLPNTNVRAIVQDGRGFIWFGTQDGLARYDGTRMRVYRHAEDDPASLSSGYITALALDPSGKIWVGTAEHGVNLYDPETDRFTRFAHDKDGLSSEGVTAIVRDPKGRMWFAMSGGGVNLFDAASKTFTDYTAKPLDAAITAINVDDAGKLWLGTASQGVIQWNPNDNTTVLYRPTPGDERGLGASPITAILALPKGKVWIGSDGDGLFSLDPASHSIVRYRHVQTDPATISDDHITVLFNDQRSSLWIGTANGLNRIDASGHLVQVLHDEDDSTSLPSPGVDSIYQDAGGVMWVGTFTNGVGKFDEFRLKFGYHRTRTHSSAFFEDDDGTLWVGTYGGGLHKYERTAQRLTIYRSVLRAPGAAGGSAALALDSGWIPAIHRDRRGTLWVSARGQGLFALDTKNETARQYAPDPDKPGSLPVDTVFDIWEDDQGLLWLATWGGGLIRFDPRTESFTAFTSAVDDSTAISSNHIYKLYPDPTDKKVLWLGTAKGGLVRFNIASGTATSFRHHADDPASLSGDDVVSVYRDPTGSVWVGTFGAGLNRVDPATGKAERFTTGNSGLTNNVVLGILPDATGKLWLSTNGGGLLQLDPKARQFLVFDSSDGLQGDEFGQGASYRSKSGELFFGGGGGFNAFSPRDITRDPYVPPVVMTAFKVFNQEVKLERPIWTLPRVEVSYSDSFEVQFAALAFAAPKKNRYAYKLEGFDDKFIETDRPYATYTKLDGGNYTLRVRGSNRNGLWNEAGIALKLSVDPPLWRTSRAYGVYLLVLAAAIYLLFHLQQERVRRAQRAGRLAAVERDLELTGAVQTGFLPAYNEISSARVQIVGLYRPASASGGDWWWHEPLVGGRHVILVGDVSGHGAGPAMVTAAVATAFRVLVENRVIEVKHVLELLNREVLRVAKGKYHMTMTALELDEATGHWTLHNAGAPPMLSMDQHGKHRVHFCPGSPLGTETGFETGQLEGRLEPYDRLLIYTDGIPEIALPNGNAIGMRRFAQQYELTRERPLNDAAAAISHFAYRALGNQPQADDWTFAMIEWK